MQVPPEFSRLTELDVRVMFGDYPDARPNEVFLLTVGSPDLHGRPWDDAAFVAELEPLVWSESGGTRFQVPFDLSIRKGHVSWGADSAAASVLLYVANHLAAGGVDAVGAASVLAALKWLRDAVQPKADESFLRTRDELEEYGRWSVRAAYRRWVSDEVPLPLIAEESTDEEWTGMFRGEAGDEYTVTLQPREGHPYRVRIGRRARETQ